METKVRKGSFLSVLRENLLVILFFLVLFAFFMNGISSAKKSAEAEGKAMLEENLRKAVVSCYAMEGAYPPSIQYLKDNYGFTYDEDKYVIGYVAVLPNIMPEMQVLELKAEEGTK